MPILPNTPNEVSNKLFDILKEYSCVQNYEGCSQAILFNCKKDDDELYLKIEQSESNIKREYNILKWLNGKLPVPEIKYFEEYNGCCFMLTAALKDYIKSAGDYMREPYENTIKLLADGLFMIQNIDISACPFAVNHDKMFQEAVKNIEEKYVKLFINDKKEEYKAYGKYSEYWEMDLLGQFQFGRQTDRSFDSPAEFYDWLIKNKPKPQEERCFSHGDYPNFLDDGSKIIGFLDVGGGGVNYKWHDIAVCVRSLGHSSRNADLKTKYVNLLFEKLGVAPDWDKINYYIWLCRMISLNESQVNIYDDK